MAAGFISGRSSVQSDVIAALLDLTGGEAHGKDGISSLFVLIVRYRRNSLMSFFNSWVSRKIK